MTTSPIDLTSFQLGVLRGARRDDGTRRFSDDEIAAFRLTMQSLPSVRPRPRTQRPRHVLHPTDEYRTT